jgi:hypothetical protein
MFNKYNKPAHFCDLHKREYTGFTTLFCPACENEPSVASLPFEGEMLSAYMDGSGVSILVKICRSPNNEMNNKDMLLEVPTAVYEEARTAVCFGKRFASFNAIKLFDRSCFSLTSTITYTEECSLDKISR